MSAVSAGFPTVYPFSNAVATGAHRLDTSGEINKFVKMHIINFAERGLRQVGKRFDEAKNAVMDLAGEKNINDSRGSLTTKDNWEFANPVVGYHIRATEKL